MKVTCELIADEVSQAAETTWNRALLDGDAFRDRKVNLEKMLRCEHSPIRALIFKVVLTGIPSFVSVHLVRHNVGVTHFVLSNRDDRGGSKDAGRMTPVTHMMILNAQTLINMARKRLCYSAHRSTVAAMVRIRRAVRASGPEGEALYKFMLPECSYRGGVCPEWKMCAPGLDAMIKTYGVWPQASQEQNR